MTSNIRQYGDLSDGLNFTVVRQLTDDDYETSGLSRNELQAEVGTWVVESNYDAGLASTVINLEDLLFHVALDNPELLEKALRSAMTHAMLSTPFTP